ncbi:transposase [Gemmobacter caeni]|uniref:transposase n=1 Tax=Gemmobacter caeni TaxID=589035 RepID=UPI001F5597E2|nr:transposase [Gemmobacter caeni]
MEVLRLELMVERGLFAAATLLAALHIVRALMGGPIRRENLASGSSALIVQMGVRHCLMVCASVVSPIDIFAADEVGRRRHWSDPDKLRIVEESLRGYRQGSAPARRYGISRSLLSIWRREYRGGTLGASYAAATAH